MTVNALLNEPLLTEEEAAPVVGKMPKTMANERCAKRHKIPYLKIGSRIYYRPSDLIAFRESCVVMPAGKELK